jgi:hypothetical protein
MIALPLVKTLKTDFLKKFSVYYYAVCSYCVGIGLQPAVFVYFSSTLYVSGDAWRSRFITAKLPGVALLVRIAKAWAKKVRLSIPQDNGTFPRE